MYQHQTDMRQQNLKFAIPSTFQPSGSFCLRYSFSKAFSSSRVIACTLAPPAEEESLDSADVLGATLAGFETLLADESARTGDDNTDPGLAGVCPLTIPRPRPSGRAPPGKGREGFPLFITYSQAGIINLIPLVDHSYCVSFPGQQHP